MRYLGTLLLLIVFGAPTYAHEVCLSEAEHKALLFRAYSNSVPESDFKANIEKLQLLLATRDVLDPELQQAEIKNFDEMIDLLAQSMHTLLTAIPEFEEKFGKQASGVLIDIIEHRKESGDYQEGGPLQVLLDALGHNKRL